MVDDHKLIQRQKQIDIGKNTLSYGRYIEAVKRYWFDNTVNLSTLIYGGPEGSYIKNVAAN